MLRWASSIWGREEDGIMNMVKSPQSSVQPVELELTLHTVANNFSVWRKDWVSLVVATFLPTLKTVACWIMRKISTRGNPEPHLWERHWPWAPWAPSMDWFTLNSRSFCFSFRALRSQVCTTKRNSTFEEGSVHVLTLLKHYFMALRATLGELIPSLLETSQDSGTENIRAEQGWIVSKGEGIWFKD